MAAVTIRNLSDAAHRALKARAAQHNRSTEAEMRAILEAAGVHNILTKCIGSNNPHNVVHATVTALQELSGPDEVATRRGLPADELHRRHVRK